MNPTASPNHFPYREHRTLAQIMRQEELDAFHRRPWSEKRLTLEEWRQRT